jgi:LmbE family N-acetylglucosaminyl deacetylase
MPSPPLAAVAALLLASTTAPPLRPPQPDAARLERQLDRLLVVGNVLFVAAHPDDENTRLLAFLANGKLLRAGYLSITRGDGGQNLIGPDLGPGLGLIRTQELLAARAQDGAEQLFTRARDFGYSKSPEESLAIWGRDAVLADVVLAIRRMRPDVVITRFPVDGLDTHGHHIASARLAADAFALAADPAYMPDAEHRRLGPWKAKRIVWNQTAGWGATEAELAAFPRIDVGGYDPWLGLSYGELAADSRSNHKSQGFGAARRRGPVLEFFRPIAGDPMQASPFDGLTLDWSRVPGTSRLVAELERARSAFRAATPEAALPGLLAARAELASLPANPWKAEKLEEIEAAILSCAGVFTEVAAEVPSTSRGLALPVTVTALVRRPVAAELVEVRLPGKDLSPARKLVANQPFEQKETLQVPQGARYSNPAWLELAATPGLYPVADPALAGIPEEPAPLQAEFVLALGGEKLRVLRPIIFRWVDPVLGERYRQVEVLPRVTLDPRGDLLLFPDASSRPFSVTLRSVGGAAGTVSLDLPEGFSSSPASTPFQLGAGGETVATFRVTPPRAAATGWLLATATVGGERFDRGVRRVDHTHIPVQTWLPLAETRLTRVDVLHARQRIGYVPGPGDQVPDALRQAGYAVTLLTPQELREQPLDRFEAIVFGIRAFNVMPQLAGLHGELLAFVHGGGTVVVQYLTNNWISNAPPDIGPYPFTIGRARVTDEDAAVETTANPVLATPNRIEAADWAGWVQERGLYFAEKWDDRYAAPLSMHDPGEKPQRGALLVGAYGKGAFVYTGLSFFRQLPAGVPGAFRLFANVIDHGR